MLLPIRSEGDSITTLLKKIATLKGSSSRGSFSRFDRTCIMLMFVAEEQAGSKGSTLGEPDHPVIGAIFLDD
jgi:hypothetical protein